MDAIPPGFRSISHWSGFLGQVGPLYLKEDEGAVPVLGVRIEKPHLNIRGIGHGGLLVTVADTAMSIVLSHSRRPRVPMVTVNLSVDFAGSAAEGDWIEAHVDVQKLGNRLAYANCYLWVRGTRILRASGVFAVMPPAQPAPPEGERFDG